MVTSDSQLVGRSTDDNLRLQVVSEVGAGGQAVGPSP